uniref:Uncharacterized protein n=1 Tax=Ditylenchus dipsaci TaxID=166011 RepID=A0A915DNC9_9BILA
MQDYDFSLLYSGGYRRFKLSSTSSSSAGLVPKYSEFFPGAVSPVGVFSCCKSHLWNDRDWQVDWTPNASNEDWPLMHGSSVLHTSKQPELVLL